LLVERGLSDRYLFDGKSATVFDASNSNRDIRIAGGCLRVDFASAAAFDSLKLQLQVSNPPAPETPAAVAEFSKDMLTWTAAKQISRQGDVVQIVSPEGQWRYFRMHPAPERIVELEALKDGKSLDRAAWRASNLFSHPDAVPAVAAWSATVSVDEVTPTSYLCVTVDGKHGREGCYAAIRKGGRLIGAPDRAPSYPCNPWEYPASARASGYTYFFPLDESMAGEKLEVVLLGMKGGGLELQPSVWLTARDLPFTASRKKFPH